MMPMSLFKLTNHTHGRLGLLLKESLGQDAQDCKTEHVAIWQVVYPVVLTREFLLYR